MWTLFWVTQHDIIQYTQLQNHSAFDSNRSFFRYTSEILVNVTECLERKKRLAAKQCSGNRRRIMAAELIRRRYNIGMNETTLYPQHTELGYCCCSVIQGNKFKLTILSWMLALYIQACSITIFYNFCLCFVSQSFTKIMQPPLRLYIHRYHSVHQERSNFILSLSQKYSCKHWGDEIWT